MRAEPIPDGLWLRLFDSQNKELQRRRRSASYNFKAAPRHRTPSSPARSRSAARCAKPISEPLPQELWENVFRVVPPGLLCTLRAVCRGWRAQLDDRKNDSLWKAAYLSEWLDSKMESSRNMWRSRFLARWWAHGRWGSRLPTVCTLMGKKAHCGTVTCVALGECGLDSGEGSALSASDDGSLFLWRFSQAGSRRRAGSTAPVVAQQHHMQCRGSDVRCPQRAKKLLRPRRACLVPLV